MTSSPDLCLDKGTSIMHAGAEGTSSAWMHSAPGASTGVVKLIYNAAIRTVSEHHADVTGPGKRRFGVATFRGLAMFTNGDLARYCYRGTYDFRYTWGIICGVTVWRFDDGSEIHAADHSELVPFDTGVHFSGRQQITLGSGRFTRATGAGTYEGDRIDGVKGDGNAFWSGTLSVNIP